MEASYLKAHPLEGPYPEWTPNFHSDRSQYSNLCARESQGTQSAGGSIVPRRPKGLSIPPSPSCFGSLRTAVIRNL